jgi:hypothetical protein
MDTPLTNINHTETTTKQINVLFDRLEHLGYQCITNKCDKFTTLRFSPVDKLYQPEEMEMLVAEPI